VIGELVHGQMQAHYDEPGVEYEAVVKEGFKTLRARSYGLRHGDDVRPFRAPVEDRLKIPQMLFGGFAKAVYPEQRFQSDSERRFAIVLENDLEVLRWNKLQQDQIQISLPRDGGYYVPDFVVETKDAKYICEVKAKNELDSPDVQEKARACARWCEAASEHSRKHTGKPWKYVLIPHDEIEEQRSFGGLASNHEWRP